MMAPEELSPKDRYQRSDIQRFHSIPRPIWRIYSDPVGQPRAVDAISFGIDIDREGYNLLRPILVFVDVQTKRQ
jgi:hypothetical protein